MVCSGLYCCHTSYDNDGVFSIFVLTSVVASYIFRNIPCIVLFHFFCGFGSVFDQRSFQCCWEEGRLEIIGLAVARFEIYKKPSEASFTLKRSSNYFFVGGRHWEYNPADQDDTLGISTVWTASKNLREFSVYASRG